MQIKTFTDDGLVTMKSAIKANAKHYAANRKVLFDHLIEEEGSIQKTVFKVPDFELVTNEPLKASDLSNVRILHSVLGNLPKRLLVQETLWSELSHDELWDYVQFRCAKKIKSGKPDKIAQSYFFTTGFKRSLFVHCVARLWWTGELIYDESASDPYHFLRLFEKGLTGKIVLFSSSSFTANKNVSLGILDAINAKCPQSNEIDRDYFTEATKYLNRISGVTLLDAIPRDEIAYKVMTHLARIGF